MTRRTRLRLLFPLRTLGMTVEEREYIFAFESRDGESDVALSVEMDLAERICEHWRGETVSGAALRVAERLACRIILSHAASSVRFPDDAVRLTARAD